MILVLQVEVKVQDASDTYYNGLYWRDARVQDLAQLEELKK